MARSIVVGSDGSERSVAAVEVAGELARRLGLSLVVAQATEDRGIVPHGTHEVAEQAWERAGGSARTVFDRLAERAGVPVDGRLVAGEPGDALVEVAAETDAAFIVVGSRGRGPLGGALLGSTSLRLIGRRGLPILIVPPGAESLGLDEGERRAVVCGLDGSDTSMQAARVAKGLAQDLDLDLVLVHAYQPGLSPAASPPSAPPAAEAYTAAEQREREAAAEMLERAAGEIRGGAPVRTAVESGAPAAALSRHADDASAAIIVVGTRGRGAAAAAVMGSTSAELAASASRPVLVVPHPDGG